MVSRIVGTRKGGVMRSIITAGILVFIMLLAAPGILAGGYQVDLTPVNNSILATESATFRLLVTNFERSAQRFQVYTLDPDWSLRFEPMLHKIGPSTQEEYLIHVRARSSMGHGTYGVGIVFKNIDTGELITRSVIILVRDPNKIPGEYSPSVKLDVTTPSRINPRDEFKIGINLKNRNPLDITELRLLIESPLLTQEHRTRLPPNQEWYKDFPFRLDPYQPSGTYPLRVLTLYRNETINDFATELSVEMITDIAETHADDSSLFRHVTTLTVENKGNGPTGYRVKLPTNLFRRLFSSAEPATRTERIGGQRYYVWDVTLEPRETVSVTVIENYRLLILLLFAAIIATASYYAFRSPLIAVKETISLKDEEGTSNLKVRIFVKNRTGRPIDGVTVIDRVPSIASYVKRETLGVVSPTKVVTAEKRGTVLKWELDILEPYEERILSYSLASKLKIVGKMRLPDAKIQFSARGGKERVTYTTSAVYEE